MTTSMKDGLVVSYRNSTSNHNSRYYKYFLFQLYLIEILHQTTTQPRCEDRHQELYLIEILHQTSTELSKFQCLSSCILSKFYIKPQHYPMLFVDMSRCILSKFYIKPQRRRWLSCCFSVVSYRNSTSNHNNKRKEACQNHVVSYRNSTSNHNCTFIRFF